MNLHGIVSGAIATVNPFVTGTVRVSTGSTTGDDGKRTPTYRDIAGVSMQVQPMTYKDLAQTDSINQNGTKKGIYIRGRVEGLVRPENRGGDLIILPRGSVTASIAGGVMTVSEIAGGEVAVGDSVSGAGIAAGTRVTGFGTGVGGVGTYQITPAQTVASGPVALSTIWLVALVLEAWPDWCKVAVTLQNSQ